jgi:hypothetical protein
MEPGFPLMLKTSYGFLQSINHGAQLCQADALV